MTRRSKIFRYIPYVLMAILLYLLCSRFPYFVDDWYWGTDSRLSTFLNSFSNPENPFHFYNNGRYFGNGLGFIAANHPTVRNLIMTVTLCLIFVITARISLFTAKESDTLPDEKLFSAVFLAGTILLLSPRELFREAIVWSSAFMIYVVPVPLYLYGLYLLITRKHGERINLLYFALPFLASFFIENLTIGNVIFIVLWLIYELIRKKRPSRNEYLYLAGAVLGLVLMFADDGYQQILTGSADETYWGAETGSLLMMIQTGISAFQRIIAGALVGNMTVLTGFGAGACCLSVILMGNEVSGKRRKALMVIALMDALIAAYFLLRKLAPDWQAFFGYTAGIEMVLSLIFLFSFPLFGLLLPCMERQKEMLVFTWIFAAGITLPLLVAEPLSMRVFFPSCPFLLLLYSELFQIALGRMETVSSRLRPFSAAAFLFAWGYLFSIYAVIGHYEQERIKYVRYQESLGYYETDFPELPYKDHVVIAAPWGETWQERYRKFYGLNLDMRFTTVSFEEWLSRMRGNTN